VQSVLETLLSNHDQPVQSWWPGQRLVLPAMQRPAMMILHDVGALAAEDQLQLLEWLERDIGRTKVVSTTPLPLMPLVEKGTFNDTLYYRLNTVSIEVSVSR
jgi:transcriptional regulator of acetoin/glycerol metabolism